MPLPLIPLLIGGGIVAAFVVKSRGEGGGSAQEAPNESAMVQGQAYHIMVRVPMSIREPDDPRWSGFDLGVVANGMGFQNVREVDDDSGGPGGDPTVLRFVADWGGRTGEFIHDLPSARIIAVTALDGSG